ncbi:MAG: HAMP domain-containing sensor histidine kinase, partial [Pseudomonadota bacterium]
MTDSLFRRFWLTSWLVLTALLVITVFGLLRWTDVMALQYLRERPDLLVQEVAAELEYAAQREVAFEPILIDSPWARIAELYLIDATGADVLKRRLPAAVREGRLRRAFESDDARPAEGPTSADGGQRILVRAVYQPDTSTPLYLFALPKPAGALLVTHFGSGRPWLLLLLTALVSAPCAWWLARSITRPIKTLEEASERLAAGESSADLATLMVGRQDEIARLASRFQHAANLTASTLARQRRLLRDVSHEVRSPLSRMHVALELLEQDPHCDRARQQLLYDIDCIDHLVEQLLTISRARMEQRSGKRRATDLLACIAECVQAWTLGATQRSVTLAYSVASVAAAERPLVPLGSEELMMVIDNVLRNAIGHAPADSTVRVDVALDSPHLMVTIADQGCGVPENQLDQLFEPFWRPDDSRSRGTGGFGLGLAIVAELTAAAGGQVSAHSREPGGLELRLSLPWMSAKITSPDAS